MQKKLKVVRPKDTNMWTTRLLEEDIKRIVEGLKSTIEEEHIPLVIRVEKSISEQNRIRQEYTKNFFELCQVLEATSTMTSPCGPSPTCITGGEATCKTTIERMKT